MIERQEEASPAAGRMRWPSLSPAGRRRIGEFAANILLGIGASLVTLIVAPALSKNAGEAGFVIAGGIVAAAGFAIFALLTRIFTEERENETAKEAVRQ